MYTICSNIAQKFSTGKLSMFTRCIKHAKICVWNEQTILNYIKVITQHLVIYIKHKRNYNTYNADFFFFYAKIFLVVLSLSRKSVKILSHLNIFNYTALPCTFGNTKIITIIYFSVMCYYKLDRRFKHFLTRARNK